MGAEASFFYRASDQDICPANEISSCQEILKVSPESQLAMSLLLGSADGDSAAGHVLRLVCHIRGDCRGLVAGSI
ncbi:hypothetical protein ElyMa_001927800 [Elysia marginata]|uniref:Uncharacterized protein n=1 Tax=Elysia marginata TaxID=1093978 RepID=A0AAV4ETZ3_9GAST|nr:hypothetical protein ElyMa_001927800 [Elysia marginata]